MISKLWNVQSERAMFWNIPPKVAEPCTFVGAMKSHTK